MVENVVSLKMFVVIFLCFTFQLCYGFECGRSVHSEGFIIGGTYIRRGDYPWIAALINFNTQQFFCGGTLITQSHVVTAAHCINTKNTQTTLLPQDIGVLLGKHNLNFTVERNAVTMLVDKIHIHPDWRYHTENYDADIAILKFLNGITFSEYIFPICWPSRAENEKKFRGTVVGWGKSENKEKLNEDLPKELQVESVINEVCFLGDYKFAIISSNRTFCAGVMNAGPCFGDSGGGLYVKTDSNWVIRGIVSASFVEKDQCDVSKYALYTDILQYADWTRDILSRTGIIPSQLDDIIEPRDDEYIEHHITIECAYADSKNDIAIPVKLRYSCLVETFDEPQRHSIAHIHGRHRQGKSNQDVEEFFINMKSAFPYIPMGIGEIFPNLELFFIGKVSLKKVERKNFEGMSKVSSLFLGFNDLVDLPKDVFYELFSVRALFIDNNKIKSLHRDLLIQMPKLEVFVSHNNRIEHLDAGMFRHNSQLSFINLNNNKLRTIGVDFKRLKQIKIVEFIQNVCVDSKLDEKISIVEFQDLIIKNCK